MQFIVSYELLTNREIPVITCCPENAEQCPIVFLNHGTTNNAESCMGMATKLASQGVFCVCIDALWHGRRSDGKLDEYLETPVYKKNYLHLLLTAADDISALLDFYENDPRVDTTHVGVTGISQGGYISFMSVTKEPRITVAAPIIGSPDLTDKYGNSPDFDTIEPDVQAAVKKHNPLNNYENIPPTALFIQCGDADDIVPVTGPRRLHEKLKPLYEKHPDDYCYVEYPGYGHYAAPEFQQRAVDFLLAKL